MYIAPGLLDQRLSFYERQEAGGDGFARPVYVLTGVFWGRLDVTADQQTVGSSPQSQVDSRSSATATVAMDVVVDPNGVVRVEGEDALYHIRGVYKVRQLQAQQITLDRVTPEQAAVFVTYEPTEVLDGYHYGTAIDGFSSGFDNGFSI